MTSRTMPARVPAFASLWAYVCHWRERQPNATAVVAADKRWTWWELGAAIEALTENLRAAGVERGDRIAMLSWQCVEFVIAFVAAERCAATLMGLSPRDRVHDLSFLLADAAPSVLFLSTALTDELGAAAVAAEVHAAHPGISTLVTLHGRLDGLPDFEDFLDGRCRPASATSQSTSVSVDCSSPDVPPIYIVYTSGSSGQPKAARLPNRSLMHNYRVGAELFGHQPFRTYNCHPIDHIGGIDRLYQTLMLGGMLVLEQRFVPARLLQCTQDERLTYWLGEATQFIRLAPLLDKFDLSSLEVVRYVGPLPEQVLTRFRETVPLVMTSYGSSETCASIVYTNASTTTEELRDGNIGHPIDDVAMRVVDDEGRRLFGSSGVLEIKSEYLFDGYGAAGRIAPVPLTGEGWFRPGDLCRENADGSFSFAGRADDVFKSGGYNVHPAEVEAVLVAHPAVKEACVIGVPHPDFIAVGRAFVVLVAELDEEALRAHVRERLAAYKVPKQFVFLDSMPLLRNDKIDKRKLKEFAP